MPITIIYAGISHILHIFVSGDSNALNPGKELVGKKTGGMSQDLELPKIKQYCKDKGITVNHYYLAILSKTLHTYFTLRNQRKGEKVPSEITAGFPVSIRKPFKKFTDIELNNQMIAAPMKIPVCDDMTVSMKKTKEALETLKNVLHQVTAFYHIG